MIVTDGRRSAQALRRTVGQGLFVAASNADPRSKLRADYVCDGTADNVEIQAAIDSLPSVGGKVVLSEGTFTLAAKVLIDSLTTLEGQGVEITITTLANSVNDDVLQSRNFSTLTGTDSSGGEHRVQLRDFTIDGNSANQTAGYGIRKYGYHWVVNNIVVRDCKNDGVWSEWGTNAGNPSGGDGMEDLWSNVKVHNNLGVGIEWRGPHDSQFINLFSFLNTGSGMIVRANSTYSGTSLQITNLHLWGNGTTSIALSLVKTNVFGSNWQIEGSSGAGGIGINCGAGSTLKGSRLECFLNETDVVILSNDHDIDGFFAGDTGIKMGSASTSVSGIKIRGKFLNPATTCVEWLHASNANNMLDIQAFTGTKVIAQTAAIAKDSNRFYIQQAGTGELALFEASGTATILTSTTSTYKVAVSHGLAVDPTVDDISITFNEQATNDYGRWWVDNISSTAGTFDVNVTADPGASNLTFGWRVAILTE